MFRLAWFIAGAIAAAMVSGAISAVTNQPGVIANGPFTAGHCVTIGSPLNGNSLVLQDTPCPTSPPMAIGQPIQGATPSACMTTDDQGKLAQTDCLTAN